MCNDEITNKYLYEKAIEGRKHHLENYNHWMNMYAIFNGALFVGLYSIGGKNVSESDYIFKLAILILGCIAGWFWFMSVCGFYRWIISWIRVVSYYESKLEENKDKNKEEKRVYRLFDDNKFDSTREKQVYPFSTQKITRAFTFCVAVIWTLLLAYDIFFRLNTPNICCIIFISIIFIVFVCIAIAICNAKFRENLTKTHKYIKDLENKQND